MKSQSAAKHCKKSLVDEKIIGKTFNMIEVLSFSHVENRRRFYNIKCLNCNNNSYMRSDRFTGTQKLNTCKNCRQSNAILKSINRATPDTVYNVLYLQSVNGAKNRNLDFNLSLEEFKKIISGNCNYCGKEPVLSGISKNYNKTGVPVKNNGIDRLDNKIGYTINNCVPCCKMCNFMKKNYIVSEFLNHISTIYKYNEGSTTIPQGSTL